LQQQYADGGFNEHRLPYIIIKSTQFVE